MVGDSAKIEKFSETLSSRYGSTPPRLLVFVGSMSLIFREEIQALWGTVPTIVCGADPYVYPEIFYRQRDTVTPKEKTHMSELAQEYNFTYMHTPIYLEESVELMLQMIPGMKRLIFLGDGIYPNPEYDQRLRELIQTKYPQLEYKYISSRTNTPIVREFRIQPPGHILGRHISLSRRRFVPLAGLFVVLFNAPSLIIALAQRALCLGIALLCGLF